MVQHVISVQGICIGRDPRRRLDVSPFEVAVGAYRKSPATIASTLLFALG